MFHKASAVPLQLGSIIKHNTQSGACMHGHTPPGWRAQAGTPHLIYYHSALPGTQPRCAVCLLSFVTCYILSSVGINGYWTPEKGRSHRCHRGVDHKLLLLLYCDSVHDY